METGKEREAGDIKVVKEEHYIQMEYPMQIHTTEKKRELLQTILNLSKDVTYEVYSQKIVARYKGDVPGNVIKGWIKMRIKQGIKTMEMAVELQGTGVL